MDKREEIILWFKDVDKDDVGIVGGKGANLGEMYANGFPVPDGFMVSAHAYFDFIKERRLEDDIKRLLEDLNVDDSTQLRDRANAIQKLIIGKAMPLKIQNAIKKAYNDMAAMGRATTKVSRTTVQYIKAGMETPFVAVRSSATAEDLPEASFAGQQASFLNVKGEDQLVKSVQMCWASLFTARAIFYREENNFPHMTVGICVIVQKMVDSDKAGVAFSINPMTNNKDEISIESAFGLGEAVVSGQVTPDLYIIDKATLAIKEKRISHKGLKIIKDPVTGKSKHIKLNSEEADASSLDDDEIIRLSRIVKKIEEHYNFPQDIEWAVEGGRIYIVQSRPVTTLKRKKEEDVIQKGKELKEILHGLGASPGLAAGPVKIVHGLDDLHKIEKGDVLVTEMTNPDMVPAMKRAAAIVTDEGGTTSHAAIVSREMGIPCIVGTNAATKILKDGDIITVNADKGSVISGDVLEKREKGGGFEPVIETYIPTRTKIYMNLGIPDLIPKYKDLNFDGIGLMRIEFIIASEIKKHPLEAIREGSQEEYIHKLAEGVRKVAETINPKPVIVRFSDFKTNEYKDLEGGEKYEPKESNPMLGWRGVSRYVSELFKPAFRLECKAIKKVRETSKNVWVMLPFVRTPDEVKKCLEIMKEEGLEKSDDFQIWLMAEVPSMIFLADKFAELGLNFSIGSNDLTSLVLGVDRDSQILGELGYFNEKDPAVLRAIKYLIKMAHHYGVKVSICGQAPSVYKEFTQFLIGQGIDSISVNPDAVNKVRKLVADLEQENPKG